MANKVKKILIFTLILISTGCFYYDGYRQSIKSMEFDNPVVAVGKDYASFVYHNNLKVEVLFYGITEEATAAGKAWIIIEFSEYPFRGEKRELSKKYYFDSSAVSTSIGSLTFVKSYPYQSEDGRFNLKEIVSKDPNHRLFVEYSVSLDDWYIEYLKNTDKCSGKRNKKDKKPKFTLNGLYNSKKPLESSSVTINTCELPTKKKISVNPHNKSISPIVRDSGYTIFNLMLLFR
ncbi:hypothetical protein RsTz2092_13350 [Deferribacterales bacterium RsTz2092]